MPKKHIIITICAFAVCVFPAVADVSSAEEPTYEEQRKEMEERFWAASRAGETVRGVLVEGNSLFNGTTAPQDRPYGDPYTGKQLRNAKFSAERNSKVFILARDGALFYPTVKKGDAVSKSLQAYRFPRVLTQEQKDEGLFTWATLVPLVGREVEVCGEVYPGYGGVKGVYIESIYFEGEYIVGGSD